MDMTSVTQMQESKCSYLHTLALILMPIYGGSSEKGNSGDVSMKNELAAVMIQSEGDNWRAVRNGPISIYGAAGVLGVIFLLAIFYGWRGRIKIDSGGLGKTVDSLIQLTDLRTG